MHLLAECEYDVRTGVSCTENALLVERIALLELLQYSHFDFAGIPVFGYSADYLDRYLFVVCGVDGLNYFPKGALSKKSDRAI